MLLLLTTRVGWPDFFFKTLKNWEAIQLSNVNWWTQNNATQWSRLVRPKCISFKGYGRTSTCMRMTGEPDSHWFVRQLWHKHVPVTHMCRCSRHTLDSGTIWRNIFRLWHLSHPKRYVVSWRLLPKLTQRKTEALREIEHTTSRQ